MVNRFYSLSLRLKLILIMVGIALLVSITFAGAVLYKEQYRLNESTRNEIASLSQIISSNVVAPLLFSDKDAASEVLKSLNFKTEISQAALYDMEGFLFAEFRNEQYKGFQLLYLPPPEGESITFSRRHNHLIGHSPIIFKSDALGSIFMAADLRSQQQSKRDYLFLIGMILVGISILALFLATQFQKTISTPIIRLNHAMQVVTDTHDFSLRVDQDRNDDIGELYRGFNDMLHQLELRDHELMNLRQRLEHGIKERTRKLDEIIRQRIDWLENMANFLKHELKNNIAAFSSSLQLIERKTNDPSLDNVLDRAHRSLRYMNQLLDSVGKATSLQASLYEDQFGRIDLSNLLLGRINDLKEIYGDQFICDVIQGVYIEGNEERISQLLDKLISNAAEHNVPGNPIEIELNASDTETTLIVSNFGANLPEDKTSIFNAFVSKRDSNMGGHLGMGLFVVKLIAESHGGHVIAKNKTSANGASFLITLPLPKA